MDAYELEKAYRVALWYIDGVGPTTFGRLLKYFTSAQAMWSADRQLLTQALGNKPKLIETIAEIQTAFDVRSNYQNLIKQQITILCHSIDADYPAALAGIEKPPPVLFVRGQILPLDQQAIAVVGTRKPTSYGQQVTAKLAGDLARTGYTIVSGLARGVDGIAHRAALEAGGRTIAVLGGGLARLYPQDHIALARDIVENGAVISMFPHHQASLPGNFVVRNRIIAGLSKGVLVTEGAAKSGTRITADYCLKQDKPVFAVPGPITSIMSEAPSELIQAGAKLVTQAQQIDSQINSNFIHLNSQTKKKIEKKSFPNKLQSDMWKLLAREPADTDELARSLAVSTTSLITELSDMEIAGHIAQQPDGSWYITES